MKSKTHDERRPTDTGIDDQRLDAAARQLHAGSLAALTPQTLRRLRSARQAGTSRTLSQRWLGWTLAGGSAAILALAIAVPLHLPPTNAPSQQIASTSIDEPDPASVDEYQKLSASLDENPEFYMWLANNHDTLALNTER